MNKKELIAALDKKAAKWWFAHGSLEGAEKQRSLGHSRGYEGAMAMAKELTDSTADRELITILESQLEQANAEIESLKLDCENPGGDYYQGLHCGVEDRDITDRYQAVVYGWDEAFEYINSCLSSPQDSDNE